jgi:HD-GYP domain-containing protein (c-di-GMP phosphodiesterase class II)
MDPALDFALTRLGEGTGLEAAAVTELSADGASVTAWREWRSRLGVTTRATGSRLAALPWLRSRLERHEVVTVAAVDELPAEADAERRLWRGAGFRAVLVAPLVVDARLGGFLTLAAGEDMHAWNEDDHHVLRVVADQIAAELVRAADSRNLAAVSETLLSFGADCARNLAALCTAAAAVTGADFVLYCRLDQGVARQVASWNAPPGLDAELAAAGGVCRLVFGHEADDVVSLSHLKDSVYAHTSPLVREHRAGSFIGYPVRREGEALSALIAVFGADVELRAGQLELVRMLGRAAVVEESRRLALEESERNAAQIEEAMERTVATLSSALAARDPYTEGHELRVAGLAAAIGAALGLGDGEVRLLRLAGTVHDVGKIVVPVEFLTKPTRLTESEFAVIRQHSQAGYDLLRPAALPEVVMDAVLQHHERLDGSGYPHGLVGDEISLFGRILAVADVAEAMSSHRPYRPALGMGRALAELESGRGSRFDAEACDVCFALFRDGGFSFDALEPVARA